MPRQERMFKTLLWLESLAVLTGCNIYNNPGFRLNVPYRAQSADQFCAPASILMWRLYDGLPEISQLTIANYVGCNLGTPEPQIADGVNHFTNTHDAYWDVGGGIGDPELVRAAFFARQITSMDRETPVIAILDNLHAVVVTGGRWHQDQNATFRTWDTVYYHDPAPVFGGPHLPATGGEWVTRVLTQVLSAYATRAADSNLWTYGDTIEVRGKLNPLNQYHE